MNHDTLYTVDPMAAFNLDSTEHPSCCCWQFGTLESGQANRQALAAGHQSEEGLCCILSWVQDCHHTASAALLVAHVCGICMANTWFSPLAQRSACRPTLHPGQVGWASSERLASRSLSFRAIAFGGALTLQPKFEVPRSDPFPSFWRSCFSTRE